MNLSKLKFVFVFLVSILFLQNDLCATHVAGGNMTYKCLGSSRYEITLEFRRDCFNGAQDAQFDDPALFSVYDGENFGIITTLPNEGRFFVPFAVDDTLNETISSICNVIGEDVCVQTTTYIDTIILPQRESGYVIAYQRCCRNNSLTNIADPLNTGSTYWVHITKEALDVCNSSPVFDRWPDAFICVNDTLRFNDSAMDIDGDSLVYFLCTPYAGATLANPRPIPGNPPPFPLVEFGPGFSENNMMGGSPIGIDSETGLVLAVPNQVGQFLIGVCVREFRDGVLLSEVRRDFEYNVRICGRDPVAIFEPDFYTKCDGLTLNFDNQTTSNFLPVSELQFTWFFDYPNTVDVSNETDPSFTYDMPGTYDVLLAVTDGLCVDTAYTTVNVSTIDDPTANFIYDSFDCDGSTMIQFEENSITSQMDTMHIWIVEHSGRSDTLFGLAPLLDVGFDQTIHVIYEIITGTGCTDTFERDIEVITNPFRVEFIDKIICAGEDAVVFSSTLPEIEVSITPDDLIIDDGNGTFSIVNFAGSQDFIISVNDGFCFEVDTVNISSASDPTFPLPDIIQCGTDTISLNEFGPDFYYYEWEGPSITDPNAVNPAFSLNANATYFVTVSTSEGSLCRFVDTLNVKVSPIPDFFIEPAQQITYCDGDSITVSVNPDFPEINWTDEQGELLGTGQNYDLVNLTSSTIITATVTTEDGCQNSNTLTVEFIELPVINFSGNTVNTVCKGDNAFLEVVSTDSITWTTIDGIVLGVGNSIILNNIQNMQLINVQAINDFGCEDSNSILVDLHPDPIIEFEPLDDIIICPQMMIPIGLMTSDSVTWFDENGDILETGSELFLNGIFGNVTYSVQIINEFGCEISDTFDITVDPSIVPEIDLSILDSINVCIDTDFSVSVESVDSITWMDLDGNILQIGNDFDVPNVVDTLTFVISVVDDFGCELLDTFELLPFEGIDLVLTAQSELDYYCEGEAIEVVGLTNAESTITWYNADTIIFVGDTLSEFFPVGDVSIIGIAQDAFGCMSTDTIDFRESQTEGEISGDNLICIDGMSELTFTPEVETSLFSIMWEPVESITIDNGLVITVEPENTTTYTATYSNEDDCITIDSFEVVVTGFFDPIEAFADPEEILLSQTSVLSTDQPENLKYEWEPTESLDDPNSSSPIAMPLETTTYFVTVTDADDCTGTAQVTVEVIQPNCDESDIFVPNLFTPNGDMLNDNFKVESNFVKELEIIIYNRLGEQVFKSNDINAQWDGTYKGEQLPPDVFGYHLRLVCINDLEYMKQGNITLSK